MIKKNDTERKSEIHDTLLSLIHGHTICFPEVILMSEEIICDV